MIVMQQEDIGLDPREKSIWSDLKFQGFYKMLKEGDVQ